jgi:hypothetical protein
MRLELRGFRVLIGEFVDEPSWVFPASVENSKEPVTKYK